MAESGGLALAPADITAPAGSSQFGRQVALHQGRLIVSNVSGGSGQALVYEKNAAAVWVQTQDLESQPGTVSFENLILSNG